MIYKVNVKFSGVVEVEIDEQFDHEKGQAMADKIALSHILATTDNPDAPDDEAFDEFVEETNIEEDVAGDIWDNAILNGVSGTWELGERPDHRNKEQQ